jgi:acyl-CoA thioesterase
MEFDSYTHPDRFGALLGYKVTVFDRAAGEARVVLTIREDHLSPAAKVHGGVIASVLDYACGIAVLTTLDKADRCSTVEIKINYFRPVDLGEELEAVAKVAFRGKKLCALIATLHRKGDGEQVAMASATFNVAPGGKG